MMKCSMFNASFPQWKIIQSYYSSIHFLMGTLRLVYRKSISAGCYVYHINLMTNLRTSSLGTKSRFSAIHEPGICH